MMTFRQFLEAKDKLVNYGTPKKGGSTPNRLLARGAIRPAKPTSYSGFPVPGKIYSRD
jgi:hypothetical protein